MGALPVVDVSIDVIDVHCQCCSSHAKGKAKITGVSTCTTDGRCCVVCNLQAFTDMNQFHSEANGGKLDTNGCPEIEVRRFETKL